MTQDRASELGEEALDQVEPRAVLRREGEREPSRWAAIEPSRGFFRYVCGMIVEDQLDRGALWISGIEVSEKFDKLTAAMTVTDERVDFAGQQINPGQKAERAMALILVIAREARMDTRFGWQIRRSCRNGLDSRLFIAAHDGHRLAPPPRFGRGFFQNCDFAIDAQNFRHLTFELGIAVFKIVAHLMRLDFLFAEYLAHRALDQLGKTRVPRRWSMLARMTRQEPRRPQFVR